MTSKRRPPSGTSSRGGSAKSREWKILILGAPQVGKTSLVYRYVNGTLPNVVDEEVSSEFMEKKLTHPGYPSPIYVSIWNLPSGTSKPSEISESFFRGAHACIFVFSTVDQQSFTDLAEWNTAVNDYCEGIPVVFAESKIDLIDETVLNQHDVDNMARSYKLRLYRCSAKANHNVEELFSYIVGRAVKKFPDPSRSPPQSPHLQEDRRQSRQSWDLQLEDNANVAPSKRRTGGVKPVFNRHNANCSVM